MKQLFLNALLLISFCTASVSAQESARPDGMRFVPDVLGQFNALAERPEAMGFRIGSTPDPSLCRHYQGLARVEAPDGTPYFLITKSGNKPDDVPACPTGVASTGSLTVVRMGSRDKNGERLRSNRLRKSDHVNDTPPPPEDTALPFYTFVHGGLVFRDGEGGVPPRAYAHPGGMQLIGHVLAVAVEHPVDVALPGYEVAPNPTLIMFFDVTNPEDPRFLSQFAPVHPEDGQPFQKAGVVAITPLPNGLYLMATTGGNGKEVHFFRSTIGDLSSPDLSWEFVDKTAPEVDDDPQQTLQFIREGSIDGDLYLAGVRGHALFGADHDKIDLYLVHGQTVNFELHETITQGIRRRGKPIETFPNTGGERLANGAAASSFYISPSGELILYVTEHDNDGPSDGTDNTIKMGEWRHENMVRDQSPTYLPTATVNGPYEVDEGSTVSLSGSATPAITKAWIQLFHETDFRSFSPLVDFDDYDKDNFDDFFTLEAFGFLNHANQARSWRWFAPPGCSISVSDKREDGTFSRILTGNGSLQQEPDLRQNFPDMFEEVDGVDFQPDCELYYSTQPALQWDIDRDGIFETTGSSVTLTATNLDGPSVIDVPAQAQHPFGGPAGQATAKVTVRNVAPQLTQFRITNEAGRELDLEVPFILTNASINVGASFTDPGVLDHQTAALTWGDGSVEPETAFASFDEAFGDGIGSLSQTHRYTSPGTFALTLSVKDDDGGLSDASTVVRILTPEQAVEEIIDRIDDIIASTTNNNLHKDLEKAREALAGNPNGSNGALEKIRNGNNRAAIAFLNQAINALQQALTEGANVATEIALLEQVKAALSS